MTYSPEELEELKLKISAAVASGRLNAWQTRFLVDISSRIDRYGYRFRLSDKQLAILNEIVARAPPRRRNEQRSAKVVSYVPRQNRSNSYRPFRRSKLVRRMSTKLTAFAMLAVVIAASALFERATSFTASSLISSRSQSMGSPRFTQSNITRDDFSITDGDTIRVNGERKGTRLVGFNTPESIEPECAEERALGQKAKARLRQLVSKGRLSLERIQCSCKPGTEDTDACNHGRSCGVLRVDGRDVGDTLISEGLAVPFVCGARSCPPTPRPWCA